MEPSQPPLYRVWWSLGALPLLALLSAVGLATYEGTVEPYGSADAHLPVMLVGGGVTYLSSTALLFVGVRNLHRIRQAFRDAALVVLAGAAAASTTTAVALWIATDVLREFRMQVL